MHVFFEEIQVWYVTVFFHSVMEKLGRSLGMRLHHMCNPFNACQLPTFDLWSMQCSHLFWCSLTEDHHIILHAVPFYCLEVATIQSPDMQCCNSVHPLGPTVCSWTEGFWPLLQQTSGVHFTSRAAGIWAPLTRNDQCTSSWWNNENHRTFNIL